MKKQELLAILAAMGIANFIPKMRGKNKYGKDLKNWKKPKEQRLREAKQRSE